MKGMFAIMKNKEEKKEIEKPIIVVLRETEESIVNSINSSKLPNFILRPMIEKIYNQIVQNEVNEYNLSKEQYEEQLKEKEAK